MISALLSKSLQLGENQMMYSLCQESKRTNQSNNSKKPNFQPTILYLAKIIFRNGEIKPFPIYHKISFIINAQGKASTRSERIITSIQYESLNLAGGGKFTIKPII